MEPAEPPLIFMVSEDSRSLLAVQLSGPDADSAWPSRRVDGGSPLRSDCSLLELETLFGRWAPDGDPSPASGPSSSSLATDGSAVCGQDEVVVVEAAPQSRKALRPGAKPGRGQRSSAAGRSETLAEASGSTPVRTPSSRRGAARTPGGKHGLGNGNGNGNGNGSVPGAGRSRPPAPPGGPPPPHRPAAQGQALRVPPVRQGLLRPVQPGGPPARPHRGAAIPLPHLRPELLRGRQPEEAPARAHRGEALPLPALRQALRLDLQPEGAPAVGPGLRAAGQRGVGGALSGRGVKKEKPLSLVREWRTATGGQLGAFSQGRILKTAPYF
ncbi:uncharacterized protein ACNS7B_002989 [Menidia menidia]